MSSTAVRVFDVPVATAENPRPDAVERPGRIYVDGDGDQAKKQARANFKAQGYDVRSLNWGPNEKGEPELVAYLSKGA